MSQALPLRVDLRRTQRWLLDGPPQRGARSTRTAAARTHGDAREWLASAGVVGLGLGTRVRGGRAIPELALKVYVEQKRAEDECEALIPASIATDRGEVPTDVHELGPFLLHSGLGWARPLRPGLGIGRTDSRGAGTLGCFVRKTTQVPPDPVYLLTCAHVLAVSLPPTLPATVLQPAPSQGGVAGLDEVAALRETMPIEPTGSGALNVADAALAEINPSVAPDRSGSDVDLPTGVSSRLAPGKLVQATGAASGRMFARIVDPDFALLRVEYPGADGAAYVASFRNLVLCTAYGAPGDSGASALDEDRRLLGLHMGAFPRGGVFCRIGPILDAFGVEPLLGV